jgi:N-acetylglucosaminyldiphosphoundecaprenol N-acetyl-beta-D-mannosaminyltransferase
MLLSKIGIFEVCPSPNSFYDSLDRHLSVSEKCGYFVCMNSYSYAVALSDQCFLEAAYGADWIIPDGMILGIASNLSSTKIEARITGYDVFEHLLTISGKDKKSIYLLGGSDENLMAFEKKLAHEYPDVIIAGSHSPPFKDHFSETENVDMVDRINTSGADILFVSMSAPKQEKWIHINQSRLNVSLCCPIGAVFDFYTGRVKRSHKWFRDYGFEWLPRLLQEPRRLGPRYLSVPVFFFNVIKENIKSRFK